MADIYPPDYETPVGKLRALIYDFTQMEWEVGEPASYKISDDMIKAYLSIAGESKLFGAAAIALRASAANEILVGKWVRTEDLQTQGAPVGDALRLLAREYETKQKAEDDNAAQNELGFEIVTHPFPYTNMEW